MPTMIVTKSGVRKLCCNLVILEEKYNILKKLSEDSRIPFTVLVNDIIDKYLSQREK